MTSKNSSWVSKVSGFFRFYGQRTVDALRRLYGRRSQRTPLQRSLAVLTVALLAAGVYAGWAGSWLRRAPAPAELAGGLDEHEAPRPAGGSPEGMDDVFDVAGVSPAGRASVAGGSWTSDPPATEVAPVGSVPNTAVSSQPVQAAGTTGRSGPDETPVASGGSVAPAERAGNAGEPGTDSVSPARSPAGGSPSRAPLPQVSITSMVLPVSGEVIQPYGWHRHPVFGDWRHSSVVVLEPAEDGLVRAALAGRVRDVVYEGGLWRISIDHAGGWQTEYAGLLEVAVDSFEVVDTGQVIGRLDRQAGWGVSFAVRQGDVAVNPLSLANGGAVPASAR